MNSQPALFCGEGNYKSSQHCVQEKAVKCFEGVLTTYILKNGFTEIQGSPGFSLSWKRGNSRLTGIN